MLSIKSTVGLCGMKPEIIPAIIIANEVYAAADHICIITSITDSAHKGASLHYSGCAIDLRTKHVPVEQHAALVSEISARLGPQFDVILEPDHIHIEFQPKDQR